MRALREACERLKRLDACEMQLPDAPTGSPETPPTIRRGSQTPSGSRRLVLS